MNLVNYGVSEDKTVSTMVSTTVMIRLEPGNSGVRIRGNHEMGKEDKLWLKFAVVIVFFNPLTLR